MTILRFFDKLEDKIRGKLSHWPIVYAFIGGIGVVIFWRGVWHTVDFVMENFFSITQDSLSILPWWDGPLSLAVGSVILLATGVFVSNFIGNEIIISGLKGEKKIAEKTESEIRIEIGAITGIKDDMKKVTDLLAKIERKLTEQEVGSRK